MGLLIVWGFRRSNDKGLMKEKCNGQQAGSHKSVGHPFGWLYESETLPEISATQERLSAVRIWRSQKALTQMNLQLANVLSDVSGMTGQASEQQITQSLEGHWQEDLLFGLNQEQEGYEFR
jgi:hypothetical protein